MLSSKPHGDKSLSMTGDSSPLAAALTVVSVLSLSLLSLFCVRCKKKSKTIHEDHQIYNPQTFQRGGSRFAVTQSKTVTRDNQIPSVTLEIQESLEAWPPDTTDEQSDYENVSPAQTKREERTYVDPLPIPVYENEQTEKKKTGKSQTPDVYANIILSIKDDEDEDYENSEFLKEQEESEPDYVNEDGT